MPPNGSTPLAVALVLALLAAAAVGAASSSDASPASPCLPGAAAANTAEPCTEYRAATATATTTVAKRKTYDAIDAWKALPAGDAGRTLAALRTAAHTDGTANGQTLVADVGSQRDVAFTLAPAGHQCPGAVLTATHTVARAAPADAEDSSAPLTAMVRAIGMPSDQAGHVFARRLGGGRDPINFVPMGTSCNQINSAWNKAETLAAALFARIRLRRLYKFCHTQWSVAFHYRNRHWPCRPTDGTYHVDSTPRECRKAASRRSTIVNRWKLAFVDKEVYCPDAAHTLGWRVAADCVPPVVPPPPQVPRVAPHEYRRRFHTAPTPFGNSPHSDDWTELLRWYNGLYTTDVVDPANAALPANARLAQLSDGAAWTLNHNVAVPPATAAHYRDAQQLLLDGLAAHRVDPPRPVDGMERTPDAAAFDGVDAGARYDALNAHAEPGTNPVMFTFDANQRLVKAVFIASEAGRWGADPTPQVRAMMARFAINNDQAGHVIKKSLGGSGADPRNFVPMSPACNMAGSAWHSAEERVHMLLNTVWRACKSVTATIEFAYADPNHTYRPTHGWYSVAATGRSGHKKNRVQCATQNVDRRLWINTPQYETIGGSIRWFERVLGSQPFTTGGVARNA